MFILLIIYYNMEEIMEDDILKLKNENGEIEEYKILLVFKWF